MASCIEHRVTVGSTLPRGHSRRRWRNGCLLNLSLLSITFSYTVRLLHVYLYFYNVDPSSVRGFLNV